MSRNIVAEVMAEPCIYGGLLATRGEVYEDLAKLRDPNGKGMAPLWLDRLTWMCKPATAEDAEYLRAVGLTLQAIQEKESVA